MACDQPVVIMGWHGEVTGQFSPVAFPMERCLQLTSYVLGHLLNSRERNENTVMFVWSQLRAP